MSQKVILCVDDERIILQSLQDQLKHNFGNNYLYEFAESADEAWELIEELVDEGMSILIIISDWLMPNVRGDELLIKVHQKFPHIVTVLLTGQADIAAIERTRQYANLHGCISKPWDTVTLITTIQSGLEEIES